MPTVLIKHIVMDRMYIKRIPFDYFDSYYSKFIKQKDFQEQVNEIISKYYLFLKNNSIWFIHNFSIQKEEDFKEVDKLRLSFNLPLNDCLIFFIAKLEGEFFVTNDHHHFNKKLNNKYKEIIKIISPRRALEEANKLVTQNLS